MERRSSISASRLAKWLALLAIALVGIDLAAGSLLVALYNSSTASPLVRISRAEPRVLVLGSSAAKYAIDPTHFLPGTYNAAENGRGLFYAAAIVRNLGGGTRPRTIVLVIDPDDFISGYRGPNLAHLATIAPLVLRDDKLRRDLALGDPWAEWKYYSRLYLVRGLVHSILRHLASPVPPGNGYEPLADGAKAVAPNLSTESNGWAPLADESLRTFEDILEDAQWRGTTLVLAMTPPSHVIFRRKGRFVDLARRFATEERAIGTVCDLTRRGDAVMDRLATEPRYYVDGAHMTAAGAVAFSQALADLIAELCPAALG